IKASVDLLLKLKAVGKPLCNRVDQHAGLLREGQTLRNLGFRLGVDGTCSPTFECWRSWSGFPPRITRERLCNAADISRDVLLCNPQLGRFGANRSPILTRQKKPAQFRRRQQRELIQLESDEAVVEFRVRVVVRNACEVRPRDPLFVFGRVKGTASRQVATGEGFPILRGVRDPPRPCYLDNLGIRREE